MPKLVVPTYTLEQRLALSDALIDGATYEQATAVLLERGVVEDALPSPESLKTWKKSDEYQAHYQARMQKYRLENWTPPERQYSWTPESTMKDLVMRSLCMRLATEEMPLDTLIGMLNTLTRRDGMELRWKQIQVKEIQMAANGTAAQARSRAIAPATPWDSRGENPEKPGKTAINGEKPENGSVDDDLLLHALAGLMDGLPEQVDLSQVQAPADGARDQVDLSQVQAPADGAREQVDLSQVQAPADGARDRVAGDKSGKTAKNREKPGNGAVAALPADLAAVVSGLASQLDDFALAPPVRRAG